MESEVANLKCLKAPKDTLDKLTEECMESHKTLHEVFDNDEERQQSYNWFDNRDRETMECTLRLTERNIFIEDLSVHVLVHVRQQAHVGCT